MAIKECPNCPGATDHTAAECTIKPAYSIGPNGVLRNANGERVAELVAWDKGKLESMLDSAKREETFAEWPDSLIRAAFTGEPRGPIAAQSAPCGNITLGGEVCRQLSGHDGPCGYVHVTPPEGDITITKNAAGAIVMVSRCDAFGEVISVIATSEAAQSAPDEREAPPQLSSFAAFADALGLDLRETDAKWDRALGLYEKLTAAWQRAQSAPVVPEGELPWTGEQLARAWYLAEYGPGHDLAPGYAVAFARELAAMLAAAPQPAARHEQGDEVRRLREALEKARPCVIRDMEAAVRENFGRVGNDPWACAAVDARDAIDAALAASAEGK